MSLLVLSHLLLLLSAVFFKTLIIGESSVVISQSLEMWPIFGQSAEFSLFQMCTVGSGSTEHSNLNFFCSVSFMKKKFHHATFIIWILKSRILEVWREMSIILLGIYFDIIFHQNNLGSKHQIDHQTFKKFKWNFFNLDITKVAWLFFFCFKGETDWDWVYSS